MKVIVNFGEKKVVVPCGIEGDISIRELINLATTKYSKLSYNNGSILNSDQVQLRLNNGAVVDPDDRVCDVVDDREELFATLNSPSTTIYPSYITTTTINSNGELSSSITSSNLSSSLSEHDRLMVPSSTNRHEVIVTDADLRNRSLRVKNDPTCQQSISRQLSNTKMTHRQSNSPPTHDATKFQSSDDIGGMYNVHIDEKTNEKIFSIILPKENSPLGIHVIPCNGDEQQVNGLVLQNIEADGRIKRQGILQINDRIIEINRANIERCSFDKAQLIFRTALLEPELELKIVRNMNKFGSIRLNTKPRSTLSEINQNNDLSFVSNDSNMNSLNTRRLGKIIKITLMKGNDGLGFKLASRDNPTGVANPIYVKTIFPKGAAIEDGRLQCGDRLLAVNSVHVTEMSLQETVALLRETHVGDTVEICISRQREGSVPSNPVNDRTQLTNSIISEKTPQKMIFDIPLNDTSSAGLGITLKGKTSVVDGKTVALGIFVKSILTGGAASRDNRLRPNDQLLVINDSSLINLSNLEAAATLHEAVRREIHPGYIKVTILRSAITTEEDQQVMNSRKYVTEVDLSLPPPLSSISINNDENELDLTTFVPPPLNHKPPSHHSSRHLSRLESLRLVDSNCRSSSPRSVSSSSKNKQISTQFQNLQQISDDVDNISANPFERETPFRQSISEKRRVTHQPNKQAVQWKQRSFHEGRTQTGRKSYPMSSAASIEILTPVIDVSDDDDDDDFHKADNHCRYSVSRQSDQPARILPDAPNNNRLSSDLIRSSSFESPHIKIDERESENALSINDEERKRQAKLRSRACNDSFRQAVDKSYCQNLQPNELEMMNENKSEKQRFRFSNLFNTKSKRKEPLEEKTIKSFVIQHQPPSHDNHQTFYLPPPVPFSSRTNSTTSSSSSSIPRSFKSHKNTYPLPVYSYSSTSNIQQQAQGYQLYRFDTSHPIPLHGQSINDHYSSSRYDSQGLHNYSVT